MHLKITIRRYKDKIYRHAKIVETYRKDGKIKQKIIKNIGRIETKEDEIRARKLLEQMRAGEKLVTLSEVEVNKVFEFGLIYACEKLFEKYGIKKILSEVFAEKRIKFEADEIIALLVSNRLYKPASDLSACEWINKEAFTKIKVKEHQIYRTLDLLAEKKEEIEQKIFSKLRRRLNLKVDLVFYDLTSTYFESSSSSLAKYGYSRDEKQGKKQIVIGVILCDGLPIAHYVFEGNTVDKRTLKQTVEDLKKRFNLRRIVFVADRGIITVENLKELEENEYDYILATKRRNERLVRKLMTKPIEGSEKVCVKEVYREGNRRYILCMNKEVRKEELENLKKLRKELERFLAENKDKKDLKMKAYKKFGRAVRFIDFTSLKIDERTWNYERKIAGRYLLVTTTEMEARKVLERYKELKEVEMFFRDLKHAVNVRPIYHRKDERIRAHVFVCVLSLLIKKLIERAAGSNAVKELRRIRVSEIRAGEEDFYFVTKLTKEQRDIFDSLKIELPLKVLKK